ncbi:hypothetical protein HDV05_005751 [Chytridiales sp. JEL 0842]|nr:hypothetical protein HDV05_005751 [Chytridiales sp. JEL 0842]
MPLTLRWNTHDDLLPTLEREAITFDASGTVLPSVSASYSYTFIFGDLGGTSQTVTVTPQGRPPTVTYRYSTPGLYKAVLLVSDQAFQATATASQRGYYGIVQQGYPASSASVTINVLPRFGRLPISLVDWNPSITTLTTENKFLGTSSVKLQVTAENPQFPDNTLHSASLASVFDSVGPAPSGKLYNLTHSYDVSFIRTSDVILVNDIATPNGLGALVIVTSDGFSRKQSLRDLSRDSTGSSITSRSLCEKLPAESCATLKLFNVQILNSMVLYATNYGLFASRQTDTTRNTNTEAAVFFKVTTGRSALDAAASPLTEYMLFTSSNCYTPQEEFIFVTYPGTTGIPQTAVTFTTSSRIPDTTWSDAIDVSSIPGFDLNYRFNYALRDMTLRTNLYLIGQSSTLCGPSVVCVSTASVVIHNTSLASSQYTTSFTFPATFLVVGLEFHSNGVDLYAYGSELWHSVDGGYNFVQLYALNNVILGVTEAFKCIRSHGASDAFGLVTNMNRVFYGRVSSRNLVPVRSLNPPSTQTVELLVDESGTLNALMVEAMVSYPATVTSYPIGFLKTLQGDIRTIDNPMIKTVALPTQSMLLTTDESFDVNLVPVITGNVTVQFYAHTESTSFVFQTRHTGYALRQSLGGLAIVSSVSPNGRLVNCSIVSPLVAESASASSAVGFSLTIGATPLGDVTAPFIMESPSLVSVTLTLSGAGTGGWQANDIGKTVIANQGSIVIIGVTSATVATGRVVRPPLSLAVVAPRSWSMYDFRSYIEYAATDTQSVTVSATTANLATVTLANPGLMSFTTDVRGMFFATNTGWGVIQDVTGQFSITITPYQAIPAATYAAQDWSIFNVNDTYRAGTYPDYIYRTRPWSLTVSDCTRVESYVPLSSPLMQLGYTSTLSVSGMAKFGYASNFAYQPAAKVGSMIRNPSHYSIEFDESTNFFETSTNFTVKVNDVGIQSQTSLSVRMFPTSLMCRESAKTIQVASGCGPTRYMKLQNNISTYDFLYGNPTISGGLQLMQTLPANYRPPSSLGDMIPTTDNIYNGDPAAPRYNDRYSISKRTGTFKACLNKANRAACGCTDADRVSMKVAQSDCINRVQRVLYDSPYIPSFVIYENRQPPALLTNLYKLTELNNRTDYCLSSAPDCSKRNSRTIGWMNPLKNDSISWLGSELYHFKAEVQEKEYCNLSVEFIFKDL